MIYPFATTIIAKAYSTTPAERKGGTRNSGHATRKNKSATHARIGTSGKHITVWLLGASSDILGRFRND
jgi:hypothetical protein